MYRRRAEWRVVAIGPSRKVPSSSATSPNLRHWPSRSRYTIMVAISLVALPSRLLSTSQCGATLRHFHVSSLRAAIAHPVTAHGPPPKAPAPAPEFREYVSRPKETKSTHTNEAPSHAVKPSSGLKKRFWRDVHVHGKPGMSGVEVALRVTKPLLPIGRRALQLTERMNCCRRVPGTA